MIISFFKRHRRHLIIASLVVVFVVSPLGVNFAHAGFCDTWFVGDVVCGVAIRIIGIPMALAAFFLWLAGTFLNFVIDYTIINLKTNLNIGGIYTAWGTIRDLINISFIFVLLYTAIGTILGIAKSDWKKVVGSVIIAAILINFSMFFTKVLIDASNIVTVAFYNAIVDPNAGGGLSDIVMNKLGLASLYQIGNSNILADYSFDKAAVISIGGAIFIGIAAFSFFAIAIMLVLRFIIFMFLLVLSPVAVVGSVIPNLGEHSKKWWSTLINQLLFAPVYFILLFIVLSIAVTPSTGITAGAEFANLFDGAQKGGLGSGGAFSTVFYYVVLIGMLFGALTIAQSISKSGASTANAWAGKAVFGTAGFAGRRTIGALGRKVAQSESLKDAEEAGGWKGKIAHSMLVSGQKTQKASFDFRGSKLGGAMGGELTGGLGKAGGKDGYAGYLKEKAKKKQEYADSTKPEDYVIDEAEREMEAAEKSGDANRISLARARLSKLKGNKDEVDKAKKEKEREMQEKIVNDTQAEKAELGDLNTTERATQKKLAELNAQLAAETDLAKRVALNAQISLATTALNDTRTRRTAVSDEITRKTKDIEVAFKPQFDQLDKSVVKSAVERRKMAYADSLIPTGPYRPSPNRAFYFGKVKQSHRQAAAAIRDSARKGKKASGETPEQIFKRVLEEMGATGTPPPATPPPATPPATP